MGRCGCGKGQPSLHATEAEHPDDGSGDEREDEDEETSRPRRQERPRDHLDGDDTECEDQQASAASSGKQARGDPGAIGYDGADGAPPSLPAVLARPSACALLALPRGGSLSLGTLARSLLRHYTNVSSQLRRRRAPASPDFSGWNWVAHSGPFSTAETKGVPYVVHVTAGAVMRSDSGSVQLSAA